MQTIICRAARVCAAATFYTFLLTATALPSRAQDVPPDVERASDDLDVPFVPSSPAVLNAMFRFAKPTKEDFVIDLGSGDGRIVITAAQRFGTNGFGVDLNKGLVAIANQRAQRAGVAERAKFYVRDLHNTDIRQASILTMYLLPEVVLGLRDRLLKELRPGTRIVSHDYHLGEWRPDASVVLEAPSKDEESIVYHWVVPARAAGSWSWQIDYPKYFNGPVEYTANIRQHFQDLLGEVDLELTLLRLRDGKVAGNRVAFAATGEVNERIVEHAFEGVIRGDRIEGTVRLSGGVVPIVLPWRAVRSGKTD